MKSYQKDRKLDRSYTAGNVVSILPTFSPGEPAVGVPVARWYTPEGKFMGWTDAEVSRKFLYGGLYYKTKGFYSIKSKQLTNRAGKKFYVTEKTSCKLAAYAVMRSLTDTDMIDEDNKLETAKIGLSQVMSYGWNYYNMDSFPDTYKLLPTDYRRKIADMREEFVEKMKQQTIKEFQNLIDAEMVQRQHVETHGVDISCL
jgi:hypothetical protein